MLSWQFFFIIQISLHTLIFFFIFIPRSLPLLLPAVEDGIFNDSWRIRQSSVELLGDLLFKVYASQLLSLLIDGKPVLHPTVH